jgi:hypothetical protein
MKQYLLFFNNFFIQLMFLSANAFIPTKFQISASKYFVSSNEFPIIIMEIPLFAINKQKKNTKN